MHDLVRIAPGVVRRFDGKRAIYYGTAEALIAAGLVAEHDLPGQPGVPRGMVTHDCTQIVAKALPKGTRYEVRVALSPERIAAELAARMPRFRQLPDEPTPAGARTGTWPFPVSFGRPLINHGAMRA